MFTFGDYIYSHEEIASESKAQSLKCPLKIISHPLQLHFRLSARSYVLPFVSGLDIFSYNLGLDFDISHLPNLIALSKINFLKPLAYYVCYLLFIFHIYISVALETLIKG